MKRTAIILLNILLLIITGHAMAELKIDSVSPNVGKIGEKLQVTINGEGFTDATRVTMSLDGGNAANILGIADIPSYGNDLKVVGNIAYVSASYSGLQVIDINDPGNPVVLGSIETSGVAHGLAVSGNHVYLTHEKRGGYPDDSALQIIDVSNPSQPAIVSSLDLYGEAFDIAIADDIAYVACADNGLWVVDVSDPSRPIRITKVDTPGIALGVAIAEGFLYVADKSAGVQVLDASDPANPFIISEIHFDGYEYIKSVAIKENIAYVTNWYGKLHIIDVSNPDNPLILSNTDTNGKPWNVTVVDNIAYVTDLDNGLMIIDVQNPGAPAVIGSVYTLGEAQGISVAGNFAYVAANDLLVIDVSNKANFENPFITANLKGDLYDVVLAGNIAYAANGYKGIQLIDVSNPKNPTIIANIDTPGNARSISLSGDTAYVADGDGGLQIINISDPDSLSIISSIETTYANDAAIAGDTAYLVDGWMGLQVIDISDPTVPAIISSLDIPGTPTSIAVSGDTAFITINGKTSPGVSSGLKIIDISDPTAPSMIGSLDTLDIANAVAIKGNTAYLSCDWIGLQVIDISDLGEPKTINSVATPQDANDVTIVGDIAYVACGEFPEAFMLGTGTSGSLQMMDIIDPSNPVLLDSVYTPFYLYSTAIREGIAFMGSYDFGLCIIQAPVEISAITVNSSTSITVTLPAISPAENYSLKVFNNSEDEVLAGAITFMSESNFQSHRQKKAIIIAAGGPEVSGGTLWDETKLVADQAYLSLKWQGYNPDQIHFLSHESQDPDGDGINNVVGVPSLSSIEDALDWAADASEMIIFMADHGSDNSMQLSSSEQLTATQLDTWLDELQAIMDGQVIIIYDACYSGSFIDDLPASSEGKRTVITSSSDSERAWFFNGGQGSFSFQFWSSAYLTGNLNHSFSDAYDIVIKDQTPLLDADGNGVSNEGNDNSVASGIQIGRGVAISNLPPWISGVTSNQTIAKNSTLTLWADGIISIRPLDSVWATIVPPSVSGLSSDIPVTDDMLSRVELTDTDQDGRYEGSFNFSESGEYQVSINAIDSDDFQGLPLSLKVTVTGDSDTQGPIENDGYADDSAETAAVIDITGTMQERNFDKDGDTDWIKFYGVKNTYYKIETTDLESRVNTVTSIYNADGTLLIQQNDWGVGHDEILSWQAPEDGVYYVKISQLDPSVFGYETNYNLRVSISAALNDGILTGIIKSVSGETLSGVYLVADSTLCNPVFSLPDGSYMMPCSAGQYTVTASLDGFKSANQDVVITAEGTTLSNFTLENESGLTDFDVVITAVIKTQEAGNINAVWQKGGEDTTSRGDRVVWGHFYASPNDVSWGSQNNPEVYAKVWYDAGGRIDVNFFHVSVPDIDVSASYNGVNLYATATTSKRYIRHYYNDNQLNGTNENTEDGIPVTGYSQSNNPLSYGTINNLNIGAVINTVEDAGPIDAVWVLGGQDTTSRGDQVVWGHFYADPSDVSWGSKNNPELFVKIWFDASGRIDVNYFHVSVPDIEVYSDYVSDGVYDNKGTTIMDDRYIRHEYTKQ